MICDGSVFISLITRSPPLTRSTIHYFTLWRHFATSQPKQNNHAKFSLNKIEGCLKMKYTLQFEKKGFENPV